jgi:NACHT domain
LGGKGLVGRFRFRKSRASNPARRRVGKNVIALVIASVVTAILLVHFYHLGVAPDVLTLIVGGGAPTFYMTWRMVANAEGGDDTLGKGAGSLVDAGLEKLAAIVSDQWNKEYEHRTFNDPAPEYRDIRAYWSAADASLTVGWDSLVALARGSAGYTHGDAVAWAAGPQELGGLDEGDLQAILERVPTGWLVVLGGSGSGKSMLMLRMIREIIDHRDAGDPVPVFVPMTSWNPKKYRLRTWLEKQLVIDYPGLGASVEGKEKGRTLFTKLFDEQKIMPILDGLDEMPVMARVEAINELNRAFRAKARPLHLVVTCRTDDYERAVLGPPEERKKGRKPNPLVAAAAIKLHNLDPDKVSFYLARRGEDERWAAVDEQLQQGGWLARALNTPLYASLASAIYNPIHLEDGKEPRDPAALCSLDGEDGVHEHLLDEFIPAVYADAKAELDRKAAEEYEEPKQLREERWLMILAENMTRGGKTSLEWWDLRGLAPSWLAPVLLGVVCGIATGIAAATGTHVGVGIGIGFGTGMLIAVAIGIAFFDTRKHRDEGRLTEEEFNHRYKRRRPGPGMAGGMIGAVIGGVAAGVAGKYHIGHQASLFSGVPEGLGMALGAGASTDFVGGFVGVLIGAFVGGYLAAVGLGPPAGVLNGLGIGIAVALAIHRLGQHQPSRTRPHWDKWIGISGGGVIGLAIGLIVWRELGVVYGVVAGVLMAALAAAPFGLKHADEDLIHIPSPGHALSRDRLAFWITALSAGLAAGAAGFLGGGMTSVIEVHAKADVGSVFRDGIGIGIASGLVVGLTFGLYHAASPEFRISAAYMAFRGRAPWRFMTFLEKAYSLTVLRQSGASYQFRHTELQKRLTARYTSKQGTPAAEHAHAGTEESEISATPAGQAQDVS